MTQPLNGIAATMFHGEGAIAQCGHCKRYTLDRKALADSRQPVCDCGKRHYWSGSFKPPGPNAQWFGPRPAAAPVEQAAPDALHEAQGRYTLTTSIAAFVEGAQWAAQQAAQPVATVKDGLTVAQPVAQEPVAWTPDPSAWKDWCSQWFGPDANDVYLARAVHALPPMAQRFSYTAAPSPVALVPLTPAQRRRLWDNSPLHHKDAASMVGFERIVTLTERAHGIQAGKAEHPGGAHG